MGIKTLVIISATLALVAATEEQCAVKHIGDMTGTPNALRQSDLAAGQWNFKTPQLACLLGTRQGGLLAIACTKEGPAPHLELSDPYHAAVNLDSPTTLNLIAFCQVFPPSEAQQAEILSPVVSPISRREWQQNQNRQADPVPVGWN